MQRARVVLNLAADGLLPGDQRVRLVEQALQEIVGAVSGLRRLADAESEAESEAEAAVEVETEAESGAEEGRGEEESADGDAGLDAGLGTDVMQRLAFATLVAARLEGGQLGRVGVAVARLRELARECEGRGKGELAQPLAEYADELARGSGSGSAGGHGMG
jgi:hypothetical protein